jgi:hypothetical protein
MILLGFAAKKLGRPIKVSKNGKLFATVGDKLKGEACEINFQSSNSLENNGHWTNIKNPN